MQNVTRPPWRRRVIIIAWVAAIGGLLCFLLFSEKSPLFPILYVRHLVNQQERFLCFEVDHEVVAQNLRAFGEAQKWVESGFAKDDPRVPAALRVLKPSAIFVHPNFVSLDFGGPLFEMDVRAFKPGVAGKGTKKLSEGLWLYTEDGSYPGHE
jgi:hypothetical protein